MSREIYAKIPRMNRVLDCIEKLMRRVKGVLVCCSEKLFDLIKCIKILWIHWYVRMSVCLFFVSGYVNLNKILN